jgi:hypothetical protein
MRVQAQLVLLLLFQRSRYSADVRVIITAV